MGTGSERSEVPVPFFDGAAALRAGKGTGTVAATRFPRESIHCRDGASPLSRTPLERSSNMSLHFPADSALMFVGWGTRR